MNFYPPLHEDEGCSRCPNKYWGDCLNINVEYNLSPGEKTPCRVCDPTFVLKKM